MRLLWDFRLFSYGYAGRGVGRWVLASARSIIAAGVPQELLIWGDASNVPDDTRAWPARWIPYGHGNWRSDLLRIPALIVQHRIDIMHYWISLGPLYSIGMGAIHPGCRTCATVHDLGVELWDEIPFLRARRRTWYWRVQRTLARTLDVCVCNSRATEAAVRDLLRGARPTTIAAPVLDTVPPRSNPGPAEPRQPYFLTLGGAPNKNLAAVLRAFAGFRSLHPDCRLIVCGDVDLRGEAPDGLPDGVAIESMDRYRHHLRRASALLFCSTREGFGIPPLEAMAEGCPVVASEIPVLRETCDGVARLVDPRDPSSIARGMADVAADAAGWSRRSCDGAARFRERTRDAGRAWIDLYAGLGRQR